MFYDTLSFPSSPQRTNKMIKMKHIHNLVLVFVYWRLGFWNEDDWIFHERHHRHLLKYSKIICLGLVRRDDQIDCLASSSFHVSFTQQVQCLNLLSEKWKAGFIQKLSFASSRAIQTVFCFRAKTSAKRKCFQYFSRNRSERK